MQQPLPYYCYYYFIVIIVIIIININIINQCFYRCSPSSSCSCSRPCPAGPILLSLRPRNGVLFSHYYCNYSVLVVISAILSLLLFSYYCCCQLLMLLSLSFITLSSLSHGARTSVSFRTCSKMHASTCPPCRLSRPCPAVTLQASSLRETRSRKTSGLRLVSYGGGGRDGGAGEMAKGWAMPRDRVAARSRCHVTASRDRLLTVRVIGSRPCAA